MTNPDEEFDPPPAPERLSQPDRNIKKVKTNICIILYFIVLFRYVLFSTTAFIIMKSLSCNLDLRRILLYCTTFNLPF